MDQKTRKIITISGVLHPRSNVEQLYLPISEGDREVVSIEDCVNDERENLALYALKSNEKLMFCWILNTPLHTLTYRSVP